MKRKVQMLVTSVLTSLVFVASGGDADLAFAPVDPTWSVPMQISTNSTRGAYCPVSVIDSTMPNLAVSFGVTNASAFALSVSSVGLKVYDVHGNQVSTSNAALSTVIEAHKVAFVSVGVDSWLKGLDFGNYMLEATLPSGSRADFRFAVRNPAAKLSDAFDSALSNIKATRGNDYAAMPFATGSSTFGIEYGPVPTVQFGPYAPMNGIISVGTGKKALDLVLLVDDTASMGDCIGGLIANLQTFVDQLLIGDKSAGIEPISDLRIKVVGFSDYEDYTYYSTGGWWQADVTKRPWFNEYAFTSDAATLKKELLQLQIDCAGGSGNDGESSYEAIYYLCKGWTQDIFYGRPTGHASSSNGFRPLSEASRAVILFTDEPPHIRDSQPGGASWTCPGCETLTQKDLDAAVREADIDLTIVAKTGYDKWHQNFVKLDTTSGKRTIFSESNLASYTGNADNIRDLADYVSLGVEAVVVEPTISASVSGPGTLSFDWRDLSNAGTNNLFTFKASGSTSGSCVCSQDNAWQSFSYDFEDGSHTFQWFYRKIGDTETSILDCGQLRNVAWTWKRPDVPKAIEIIGDSELESGAAAQYVARITFENGSQTNMSYGVIWQVSPDDFAYRLSSSGYLESDKFTGADKKPTIFASYSAGGKTVAASKVVTIRHRESPPAAPKVEATDGTSSEYIEVSWSEVSSDLPVLAYEVRRAKSGPCAPEWITVGVVTGATVRTLKDWVGEPGKPGVLPGEEYLYEVRAQSNLGWGDYGSDTGWAKVVVSVEPTHVTVGSASTNVLVSIHANAAYSYAYSGPDGVDSVSALTDGEVVSVRIPENTNLVSRSGNMTVTAGAGIRSATATFTYTQTRRPGALDYIEIVGDDDSLEGGKESDYRAIAHFDDGTERDVTGEAVWTLKDGKDYGNFSAPGHLVTKESDVDKRTIKVDATYTGGYGSGTRSAQKDVEVRFTNRLRRPIAIEILGADSLAIDVLADYTARVTYNDGSFADNVAGAAGAVWSVRPGSPSVEIFKSTDKARLVAHAFTNLTLSVSYSETVGKLGGGTETATVTDDKAVSVVRPISIPVAVDVETDKGVRIYDLPFTVGATTNAVPWYGQAVESHDGVDAARGGCISGVGESWMETVTTNAGELAFWWTAAKAVSGDRLAVSVDGVEKHLIDRTSGEWQNVSLTIHAGVHKIRWTYAKGDRWAGGAVFVDQVSWRNATPPDAPVVTASDGDSTDGVDVTWTEPGTERPITGYDVYRDGELVATNVSGMSWTDAGATPGEDYTYAVRAKSEAGTGDAGTNVGWRKVLVAIDPASLDFGYLPSNQAVTVTSNAPWRIESTGWRKPSTDGELAAAASGDAIEVSVPKNTTLDPREGTVVVIAGEGTEHPERAELSVLQSKRPAMPTKLEIISGPTTLEGGSNGTFTVVATFDDGSKRDVTADAKWTVSEGDKYGSFDKPGHLVTEETTDLDGKLKVDVTYSNSDYEPVTLSTTKDVDITFSMRLKRPVSISISGPEEVEIAEAGKPYAATVRYNNGDEADVTVMTNAVWTSDPARPCADLTKGAACYQLTPYVGDTNVVLTVVYTETCGKMPSGDEPVSVTNSLTVTVPGTISLPIAVDAESMAFATGASPSGTVWYGQAKVSQDGIDAAQSGRIFGAGESWMKTVVTNAGDVSFWWKTSCEPTYDSLSFAVDGVVKARTSGTTNDWRQLKFEIPGGTHVLRWTYAKDDENDVGQDCGWVDQLVWEPLPPPAVPVPPPDAGGLVLRASDGTSPDYVDVEWEAFESRRGISAYELSRRAPDGDWEVLALTNALRFVDASAEPGVDYQYRVRAYNDGGWSAFAEDTGWRSVVLTVDPSAIDWASGASTSLVSVVSNCCWTLEKSGDVEVTATDGGFVVSLSANTELDPREATVTVSAGRGDRAVKVEIPVVQQGHPPRYDVGFVKPDENWRTRLQVATNTVADGVYAPVSVFTFDDPLDISFGWTNRGEVVVTMPPVRFRLYAPSVAGPVSEWTVEGRANETNAPDRGAWSGHWPFEPLRALRPGDYRLEAELAPGMNDVNTNDNVAIFRFAVRNAALSLDEDVFGDDGWMKLEVMPGNDFAQVPHAAERTVGDGADAHSAPAVQFGPYVPMNGVKVTGSSSRKALDLVLLIDDSISMGEGIAGLVKNVSVMVDQLLKGDANNAPVSDLRIKVVGFYDYKDYDFYGGITRPWFQEYPFSTDPAALKQELAYLRDHVSGGSANDGESSYDALYYICKGWTQDTFDGKPRGHQPTEYGFRDSEDATRVVLIFTDEPPHVEPFEDRNHRECNVPGCEGLTLRAMHDVLKEAGVHLMIVGDGLYQGDMGTYTNGHKYRDLVEMDPDTRKMVEPEPQDRRRGALAKMTGDADFIRSLAGEVSSRVVTKVTKVEPTLTASVKGSGVLTFKWCNKSTAGEKNTFSFECDGGMTNLVNKAGTGWVSESLRLENGSHTFKWSYGKVDYEGSVSDCGLVGDIVWAPDRTQLSIDPKFFSIDHRGAWDEHDEATNAEDVVTHMGAGDQKVRVTCNSTWTAVTNGVPDWITFVAREGVGDGEVVFQVATNETYETRRATVVIRADECALDATNAYVEQEFRIEQKPSPYVENGKIQLLTVGVKPRWPWNDTIDIDFRVITPEKTGTPVKITFYGVNNEGGEMLNYYPALKAAREVMPRSEKLTNTHGLSGGTGYVNCPTSGLYRVTWNDMAGSWSSTYSSGSVGGAVGWKQNGFHSPAFSVRLKAECTGKATVELPSDPVRVDTRQNSVSTSSRHSPTERSGGSILSGTEMIGHPEGKVDPIAVDSTDRTLFPSNGWNNLDFVKDLGSTDLYSNRFDRVCVINDAYVEGGLITNDVIWRADKVHVVRDNVFVHKDHTLTIEDGAVVKFCYNTFMFIYRDPTKTGVEEFNIRIKGSYWTCGFDSSYGGDTLRHESSQSEWNSQEMTRLFSNDPKDGTKLTAQTGSTDSLAATKVCLKYLSGTKWNVWKYRYYSRGQTWGALPRPSFDGLVFYGWYKSDPYTNFKLPLTYTKTNMIDANGMPFDDNYRNSDIYALMAEDGWATTLWDPIDAGGGQVELEFQTYVYDGKPHRPAVSKVSVNDSEITNTAYSVEYGEGNWTDARDYEVKIVWQTPDYATAPTNGNVVTVEPRSIEGGEILFSNPTNGVMYLPLDKGARKPDVMVHLPEYMGSAIDDDIATRDAVISDLESTAPKDHVWPEVGEYRVVASYEGNPNYTGGALTNIFRVSVNPEYVFTNYCYSSLEEARDNAPDGKRIIRFSGRKGEVMLDYWMDEICGNTKLNDFVCENFVGWMDMTDGAPFIGVRSPADDQRDIVTTNGVLSVAELLAFFEAAFVAPELPVDASGATLTLGGKSFTYDGTSRRPTVTVTLGGEMIASDNYDLVWSGDGINVGEYTVSAVFNGKSYMGETASVAYEVVPKALTASDVSVDPASAVYDGRRHKPTVSTGTVTCLPPDYGTGDFAAVGTYPITVTASGNYTGSVTKDFTVVAKEVVDAVIELDAYSAEIKKGDPVDVRPHVLSVYDAERIYTDGDDYDLTYSAPAFTNAGVYTITATFKGGYSGSASVDFVVTEAVDATVSIEGDLGADVKETADGITIRPSEGVKSVTVNIPTGVDKTKVTVEVSAEVKVVRPNGASIRIARGDLSYDINENLNVTTNGEGEVDLENATVKEEIVKEVFDKAKGAEVNLDPALPSLSVVTREGLLYSFREGATLEALKADTPETHVGDGKPWPLPVGDAVKGGASGFFGVGVEK